MCSDGIYNYMKKQSGPDSVHLKSKEDLQNFVNNYDASIVGMTAVIASHLGLLPAAGLMWLVLLF